MPLLRPKYPRVRANLAAPKALPLPHPMGSDDAESLNASGWLGLAQHAIMCANSS